MALETEHLFLQGDPRVDFKSINLFCTAIFYPWSYGLWPKGSCRHPRACMVYRRLWDNRGQRLGSMGLKQGSCFLWVERGLKLGSGKVHVFP